MNTILICLPADLVPAGRLDEIRQAAPDMTLLITRDREEIETHAGEVEIACGWLPRELLPRLTRLRWFQQWGAGADWLLRHPEAAEMDFILTNVSGLHAIPISEHILTLMLAFARHLPNAVRAQDQRRWADPRGEDLLELAGKTMVLVGVGAIGQRTAVLAAALGMRVLGVRRHPSRPAPAVAAMFGPEQLRDLLPQADFLVLTAPLTPETRGMIGEPELAAMKRSAYLVNIGRGGTVQEPSLVAALQGGRIAGAGLDVFETEPLPAESLLWGLDNVIITAHYSGATPHYHDRALAIFVDNLRRLRAGEPLRNVVDKRLGY